MTVLITGSRAPVVILLARALYSAGVTVYTADSLRPNFGMCSRTVVEDFLLPSPRFAPQQYLEEVASLCTCKQIDVIIPTCEETFTLASGRSSLPKSVNLFSPALEILETLHHKGRGTNLALELGITTPETRELPDFTRDGILKRVYSRFSGSIVCLIGSETQRRQAASIKPDDGMDWIWQEWINGSALCTYSLAINGKIVAHAPYRTPYQVGQGAGIYYDAVTGPLFDATLEVAQSIASHTKYTGSLSLDFIKDAQERIFLIEINPRATMGVALLTHQHSFGICLKTVLESMVSQPSTTVSEHHAWSTGILHGTGRRQLKAAMLLLGRNRRWSDIFTTPDVLEDPSDPGPARAALRNYLTYALEARKRGMSATAFSTYDIEWNG